MDTGEAALESALFLVGHIVCWLCTAWELGSAALVPVTPEERTQLPDVAECLHPAVLQLVSVTPEERTLRQMLQNAITQ